MGGDERTLTFYTREAPAYAEYAAGTVPNAIIEAFAAMLPVGAKVLDFGCGSGWAAHEFQKIGFRASGFDGSSGLAEQARQRYGIDVTVARFEDFAAEGAYDGIWASFCLLHDSREAMPEHLARLHRALIPRGAIYLGLKEGEGTERDALGRLYTFFKETEMHRLMADAGFEVLTAEIEPATGYDGSDATSLHVFARRA